MKKIKHLKRKIFVSISSFLGVRNACVLLWNATR